MNRVIVKLAIFFVLVFSFVTAAASAQELYFDPHFEIISNDRFDKDGRFLVGDAVTIRGTSSWYDESTDEDIPIPDTAFRVTIKNPDRKIIFEDDFISDYKGEMEISFPLTENHKFGEYQVEVIAKVGDHQRYLDLPFYLGPLAEKTVLIESSFDLWLEDPPLAEFSRVDLIGVVCSDRLHKQYWDDSVFVFPLDGHVFETKTVLLVANFTDPDGNFLKSGSMRDKDSCTSFAVPVPPTDVSGKWSAYVSAWWMNDGILYETQSDVITFDVGEPTFYNDAVEKIDLDLFSYVPTILDLSKDGDEVLLTQREIGNDLAILNLKDGSITQLWVELPEGREPSSARFSNGAFLYIQHDQELWRYHPESKESEKILSDIRFYDVLDDGSIIYSASEETESSSLYSMMGDGSEKKLIVKGKDLWDFDVNGEGTKLVHRKILDSGYGWKDSELQIIDLETGGKHSVPNVELSCGGTPMWAPNDDMIVYSETGCGRGWPGGAIYISTTDGSYTETLIPSSKYAPQFAISPDGSFLLSRSFGDDYHDPGNLYKITLAKPIPEFETIAMMILVASVFPIVMLSKSRKLCY